MPATRTVRTVAELMSTPAVTALRRDGGEAAKRMAERQGARSSSSTASGRSASSPSATSCASAPPAPTPRHEGQRVDDRSPTRSRPTSACRRRSTSSPSTATGTSRSSTTASSSASCRCATSCASRRSSRSCTRRTIEAPPGLEGVIVAETAVGDVRGLEGFYHYRQYNAVELADKRPLEDVWHLLFEGHLPTHGRARGVRRRDRPLRVVPRRRSPSAARDRPASASR